MGMGVCKSSSSLPPYLFIGASVSFTGKFLPNFDLKNIILTYTKDFS
jgi:hypothetical protein